MSDRILSEEERERIRKEANDRDLSPSEHASELLEKGRKFERLSQSYERVLDEIQEVQSGDRSPQDITLPDEDARESGGLLPTPVYEEHGDTPYGWEELSSRDRQNIRRYAWYRYRQGADEKYLYHEVSNLVALAAFKTEEPLSTAQLQDFDDPTNRTGRALDRFLRFIGNHPQV